MMNLLLENPSNRALGYRTRERLSPLDEPNARREKVQKIRRSCLPSEGRFLSGTDNIVGRYTRRARGLERSNTAQHTVYYPPPLFSPTSTTRVVLALCSLRPGFTTTFFSDSVLPREGGARCVSSPYFPLEMLDTRPHFPLDRIYVSSLSFSLSLARLLSIPWLFITRYILLPGVELIN